MPWLWSALMPHPPVIIPEVGHGREREASATVDGIELLSDQIADRRPECVLVLSPHQPYAPMSLFINTAQCLKGSFIPFGSSVSFEMKTSAKLQHLAEHLTSMGIAAQGGSSPDLTSDQGTLVPLYYMRKALRKRGYELPDVVLASPIGLNPKTALLLGEALASYDDGSDWGLLASGDLSHRLKPTAPSGYSPTGKIFDAAVVSALTACDPSALISIAPREREEAGECGLCSAIAMLGLCRSLSWPIDVISYEGPFGVGYCNALALP
jgi:aromatic ring-opening dioxygenase LigB subunit